MDKNEIISKIAENKFLINYAKKKCNYRQIWKDLHQELMICLLLMPDEKFNKITNFDYYCAGIINNFNNDRLNNRTNLNNAPNSLIELSNTMVECSKITNTTDEYDHTLDAKFDKTINVIKNSSYSEVDKKIIADFINKKSLKKTSRTLNLNYMAVIRKKDKIIKSIKKEIK